MRISLLNAGQQHALIRAVHDAERYPVALRIAAWLFLHGITPLGWRRESNRKNGYFNSFPTISDRIYAYLRDFEDGRTVMSAELCQLAKQELDL